MSSVCDNKQLVIVDLDTSGLFNEPKYPNSEVLGIAAEEFGASPSNSPRFSRFMMPLNGIPKEKSAINKITARNGKLWYNDEEILPTVSQRDALEGLLQYLREFKRPCILIAHNCPFHCNFLMRMIIAENLEREFAEVVAGFIDTLAMFEEKYPKRRYVKDALTLKTLAAECALPTQHVRQAGDDLYLLSYVLAAERFEKREFVENMMNFATALQIFRERGRL